MSKAPPETSGRDQVAILVKAAPHPSEKYRETVCTAGITFDRKWIRLFPIAFRSLDEIQKFKRWDVVEYSWRKPNDDQRVESRRADQSSLKIIGQVDQRNRFGLVDPMIVDNLKAEREAGRSLALVRPRNLRFSVKDRSKAEMEGLRTEFEAVTKQGSLFDKELLPYEPCPFSFYYEYDLADGHHKGTCQDWELDGTFFNWRNLYGEADALIRIKERWGEEFAAKDIVFAMGTHSRWQDTWLINDIIQLPENRQAWLF